MPIYYTAVENKYNESGVFYGISVIVDGMPDQICTPILGIQELAKKVHLTAFVFTVTVFTCSFTGNFLG